MPTTITTIQASDQITNSRTDLNNNFASLNTNKIETSVIDTDPALTANSDASIPSQKAVKTYVDAGGSAANLQRLLPTGTILPYAAAAAPSFFLLCDGSAVSRTIYAALFAVIGTTYGAGNGSTTFNLPDARGRVILGAGTGTKVGTFVSRSSNVITLSGLSNVANNEFQTGQAVTYHTSGSVITGLTNDTVYYLIRTGNLTFSLATTLANAQNAVVISLSSDGTGTQTFTETLTVRTVGDTGGEETHAMSSTEILSHVHDVVSSTGGGGKGAVATVGTNITPGSSSSIVGGNVAMNNLDPFFVASYIIKT